MKPCKSGTILVCTKIRHWGVNILWSPLFTNIYYKVFKAHNFETLSIWFNNLHITLFKQPKYWKQNQSIFFTTQLFSLSVISGKNWLLALGFMFISDKNRVKPGTVLIEIVLSGDSLYTLRGRCVNWKRQTARLLPTRF